MEWDGKGWDGTGGMVKVESREEKPMTALVGVG